MSNKKGQGSPGAGLAVIVAVIAVTVLVGWYVVGIVANVTPHDTLINNESICTTCSLGTLYTPTYTPLLNDSTLECHVNVTSAAGFAKAVNVGNMAGVCSGYNLYNTNRINFTNTSTTCTISNVTCSYTYDNANDFQQNYFSTFLSNSGGAWGLLAVAVIVMAAVAIVTVLYMLVGVQ